VIGSLQNKVNLYSAVQRVNPSYTINPDGTIDVQAVPVTDDTYTASSRQSQLPTKRKIDKSTEKQDSWKWLLGITAILGSAFMALGLRGRHIFLKEYQEAVDDYLKEKPSGELSVYKVCVDETKRIRDLVSRYKDELKALKQNDRNSTRIKEINSTIRFLEQRLEVNKQGHIKCNLNQVGGEPVLVIIPRHNTGFSVHEDGEKLDGTTSQSHHVPSIGRDGNYQKSIVTIRDKNPDHSTIATKFTQSLRQNPDLPSNFYLDSHGKVVGFDIHSFCPLVPKWCRFIAKGLGLQSKLPVPETTSHYIELRDGDSKKLAVSRINVHRPNSRMAKDKK
jgi:hypothetical protein